MNHSKVFLPPATCPNDCIVGPTDLSEVIVSSSSSSSSWGTNNSRATNNSRHPHQYQITSNDNKEEEAITRKKRKHNDDNSDGSAANIAADTSTNSFQKAIQTFLSSGCCVIPGSGRRRKRERRKSNDDSTTNNLLPEEELSLSCLPPEFVDICLHRAKTDYMYLNNILKIEREKILTTTNNNSNSNHQHHHKLTAVTRQDYSELCARDGGRIDIRYKMNNYPYNCGGLIYNTIVYPLIQELLNGSSSADNNDNDNDNDSNNNNEPIQLVYAGVMWGMPIDIDDNNNNSSSSDTDECCHPPHQKWHADGGHLFSQAQQDQLLPPGFTLPPHCINVFYPLVDLTQENGPTEFRIGSHRHRDNVEDMASKVEFPLLCPAGGAVLFDYRIQHRGRANVSSCSSSSTTTSTTPSSTTTKLSTAEEVTEVAVEEENTPPSSSTAEMEVVNKGRPVLYLAYAKTWFKDHGNTRRQPVPYGKGFENYDTTSNSTKNINDADCDAHGDGDGTDTNNENDGDTNISNGTTTATAAATEDDGEPWMLFQMTVELPNNKSEIIRVHKGDIAVEVSQQFCYKHSLSDDFISILTQTIQQQMNECCMY
ncbi:hypothetical protein FRACYDRAFT_252718 [Fragilariopsis cylindrus CCMP1102]|uniref:PhyH-domain-containing protein n=1 Tax=Fragilariopsis cylindrus CCMP1102 TaxID=635003 RepID=A0A1E7ELQ9_9STRA|nr:hypothetical protein FRACYDRAFT_252718 [Fragilariopsis cylindrus CCMP1102]|eukprot:OEU06859.1 hypothetical protein FRACYDRAFT_252718 [Fragilariopsis cylindrus CCMP1102]